MSDRRAPHLAVTEFATATDPGRRRLANEDAVHFDARLSCFIVCDGVGGRPAGEAASRLVAHALPHLFKRRLRALTPVDLTVETPGELLAASAVEVSGAIRRQAKERPAMFGMACTLIAALIDAERLHLVHVGDSRAYLLRDRKLVLLTRDDAQDFAQVRSTGAGTERQADQRRLLTQTLGTRSNPKPTTRHLLLKPGDRLLLCTDGLTDPLPDVDIGRTLGAGTPPLETAHALIDQANAAGGPDNITVAVVDYQGVRPITAEDRKTVPRPAETKPGDVVIHAMQHLAALEADLQWLHGHAATLRDMTLINAMALVKRELGRDVAARFLGMRPSENATHVFHRACTDPESVWRQRYTEHVERLAPELRALADYRVRLSPLLTAEDTSDILAQLWRSWRTVEARYFAACQRDAISASEKTLTHLIQHMLDAAKTIAGLIDMLPRFLRESKG